MYVHVFSACHDIDQWTDPYPGETANLPIMGTVIQVCMNRLVHSIQLLQYLGNIVQFLCEYLHLYDYNKTSYQDQLYIHVLQKITKLPLDGENKEIEVSGKCLGTIYFQNVRDPF
jgi:hypothetical protein